MATKKTTKTKTPAPKAKARKKQAVSAVPAPRAPRPATEPQPTPVEAKTPPAPANEAPASLTTAAVLPPPKLSAIEAAVKILGETGRAMNCQELITTMAAKGYWTSPGGKTPSSTLYASILRELKVRGPQARFQKTERGKFTLHVPS
jgi:HB1, ASXL, restriction endonuclease HTH domain